MPSIYGHYLDGDAVGEFRAYITSHQQVEFMKLDLASLKSTVHFVKGQERVQEHY